MFTPIELVAVAGVAILIFGADKLPKLARSAGQAKKEFMVGQAEADVAAEKARLEARARVKAQAANAASVPNGLGAPAAVPDPQTGSTFPTTTTPPHQ